MAYIIFIQDARKGISYANGFEAGYLGKFGVAYWIYRDPALGAEKV